MTISTTSSYTIQGGDGVNTAFPFAFRIPGISPNDQTNVIVTITNATVTPNVVTVLLDTQYSITGVSTPAAQSNAGVVTYPLTGSPLASGWTITIARNIPLTQPLSLPNQSGYYPAAIEAEFDRLEMQIQQVNDGVNAPDTIVVPSIGVIVESYAELRTIYSGSPSIAAGSPVTLYAGDGTISTISGLFYYDAGDTTSADNGGTIIVDTASRRWKRVINGDYYASWWGALANNDITSSAANIAALNEAISVVNVLGGGVVNPGNGTLYINDQPVMKSNVWLKGSGDSSILKMDVAGWAGPTTGADGQIITNENYTPTVYTDLDIRISDILIDGNGLINDGGAHAIRFAGVLRCRIEGVTFRNCVNGTAFVGCKDWIGYACFYNLSAPNTANCGFDSWWGNINGKYELCTVRVASGATIVQGFQATGAGNPVEEEANTNDVTFVNCSAYGVKSGTNAATAFISNSLSPSGLHVSTVSNAKFIGCYAYDCDTGYGATGQGSGASFIGNHSENCTNGSLNIGADGGVYPSNVIVIGHVSKNDTSSNNAVIYFDGGDGHVMGDCTVVGQGTTYACTVVSGVTGMVASNCNWSRALWNIQGSGFRGDYKSLQPWMFGVDATGVTASDTAIDRMFGLGVWIDFQGDEIIRLASGHTVTSNTLWRTNGCTFSPVVGTGGFNSKVFADKGTLTTTMFLGINRENVEFRGGFKVRQIGTTQVVFCPLEFRGGFATTRLIIDRPDFTGMCYTGAISLSDIGAGQFDIIEPTILNNTFSQGGASGVYWTYVGTLQISAIVIDDSASVGTQGGVIWHPNIPSFVMSGTALADYGYQTDAITIANKLSKYVHVEGGRIGLVGEGVDCFGQYCTTNDLIITGAQLSCVKFANEAKGNRFHISTASDWGLSVCSFSGVSAPGTTDTEDNVCIVDVARDTGDAISYANADRTVFIFFDGSTGHAKNNRAEVKLVKGNSTYLKSVVKDGITASGTGNKVLVGEASGYSLQLVDGGSSETYVQVRSLTKTATQLGLSGNQTLTTAIEATLAFNTVRFDEMSDYVASYKIRPKTPGPKRVFAQVRLDSGLVAGSRVELQLEKAGTPFGVSQQYLVSGVAESTYSIARTVQIVGSEAGTAAADLTVTATVTSVGTITALATASGAWFEVTDAS
jgi:hypothetical protein